MKLNFSAIKSQIETNEAKDRPLVLLVDDEEPNRRTMSQVLSATLKSSSLLMARPPSI